MCCDYIHGEEGKKSLLKTKKYKSYNEISLITLNGGNRISLEFSTHLQKTTTKGFI